jgi:hypothetical protein
MYIIWDGIGHDDMDRPLLVTRASTFVHFNNFNLFGNN